MAFANTVGKDENCNITKAKITSSILANIQDKLQPTIGNDTRCRECYKKLASLDDNRMAYTLIKYCLQYKREADIANSSLTIVLLNLLRFARKVNKPFTDVTRDDVLVYLGRIKVGNNWKRIYTISSIVVTRFFKWLYSPDIGPKERPKPAAVVNLGRVKLPKKTYNNKDIWTLEARFINKHNLAILSKETLWKILKKDKKYQEGRQPSGKRETIWKGIKLKEEYNIDAKQETLDVSEGNGESNIFCRPT